MNYVVSFCLTGVCIFQVSDRAHITLYDSGDQ